MNLFQGWNELGQMAFMAVAGFLAIVLLIRVFGTRSTAKMNNFDWIITVTMGSILASVILFKDVALAEGLMAVALLLVLQYVFSWLITRHERLERLLLNSPCLLFYDGSFLEKHMRKERVSDAEIVQAMRQSGYRNPDEVLAVVLETNAELSVIGRPEEGDGKGAKLLRRFEKPSRTSGEPIGP